jgi:methylmalonyl-CoA/ethylmalonyl-CoA epimerase
MIAGLTFHHHGLAVRNDEQALIFLAKLGYVAGDRVHDTVQDVKLRLCTHEHLPTVEIVMPGDGDGPTRGLLARNEGLLYHTCYEIDDRAAVLDELEEAGLRAFEVLPPTPALLFGNRHVSFHTIRGFGLIELLDRH